MSSNNNKVNYNKISKYILNRIFSSEGKLNIKYKVYVIYIKVKICIIGE